MDVTPSGWGEYLRPHSDMIRLHTKRYLKEFLGTGSSGGGLPLEFRAPLFEAWCQWTNVQDKTPQRMFADIAYAPNIVQATREIGESRQESETSPVLTAPQPPSSFQTPPPCPSLMLRIEFASTPYPPHAVMSSGSFGGGIRPPSWSEP